MCGCNAAAVFAVGAHGTILRWDGAAWQAEVSGTTAHFHDVWAGRGVVWAVSSDGRAFRTSWPCIADLATTGLRTPPASVAPGEAFTVADTVRNRGTAPAEASTTRYYLSTDRVKNAGDVLLGGSRAVPALAPAATSTGETTAPVRIDTTPGTYYLIACADALGVVAESSQANNCRASTATIAIVP